MEKSRIDWTDSTWNPVTGCYHDCKYCYARGITARFGDFMRIDGTDIKTVPGRDGRMCIEVAHKTASPYPEKFTPTLYRHRLMQYARKKGRVIFVCSMADLFGEWVPDEWIRAVFDACAEAPQHKYLFLTKNPARYEELEKRGELPAGDNMWYGYSYTGVESEKYWSRERNVFISMEPLLKPVEVPSADWVIIGAETGRRKEKVVPERKWVESIVDACRGRKIPIFMKESLSDIWGEPIIQEYPEKVKVSPW